MALTIDELKKWVDAQSPDDTVAVSDGGLILVTKQSEAYLEVGGVPEEEIHEWPPSGCW